MNMNRVSGAAEKLLEGERKALAVRVLTGLESITDLADELGVSRNRGVMEFLRDVVGWSMSIGTVHGMLEAAARKAGNVNAGIDLSDVRVGACTTRSFKARNRCWPAWTPRQRIATCWRVKRTVTATPGACICWIRGSRD